MERCSGCSCIIGDPSKVSGCRPSNTYHVKQSHVFFKTGVSFGLPLKVKKEKPVFSSYKSAMAQQQTYPSSSNSIQVIGSKYCMQYPLDLAMGKKIANYDYVASHRVDKTIKIYVTRDSNCFHHFVFCDDADEPIVTICKIKERWQVYRGRNTDYKSLLFSVKKSSMKHSINKVAVNIYLSSNVIEDECDFEIAENWLSKNTCDVYMGDNIIAQIQKNENRSFENDKLKLYVYPYVDYAFIVALSMIVNEMDCLEDGKTLANILADHILRPIKFMARLLGRVLMVSTKSLAPLLSEAIPIILDMGTYIVLGIGILLGCVLMACVSGLCVFSVAKIAIEITKYLNRII